MRSRVWFLSILTILMGLFVGQGVAQTNNVYIAQTAAGSANGSSCANAYAYTYFNTSGNWTSSVPSGTRIGPGTTVHLCGGTYAFAGGNSNGLTFQGSGSSSSPITLQADAAAMITAPYWGNTSGPNVAPITTNGNSYITINGQSQLTLQASANGTNLANQVDWGNGLIAKGGSNVTIENLTVSNIYIHSCALPIANCTDEGGQDSGGISAYGSNLLVTGNTVHDAKLCIGANYSGGTTYNNETFSNNTLYDCDHGLEIGDGGSDSLTNLIVSGNNISNFQNWDDYGVNNHHDGIHQFAYNSGSVVAGYMVYNNYIHGDFGANFNAAVYQESSTNTTGTYVFNNLIVDQSSAPHLGCGMICLENVGAKIYNNTIDATTGHGTEGINVYYANDVIENNTVSNMGGALAVNSPATYANTTINFNNYYGIGGSGWNNQGSFSGWQSVCHCDANSSNANPNLSAAYTPTSASTPLIQQGVNLSGLSIPLLNLDMAGMARPAMPTNWGLGAYQYQSGVVVSPPTGFSATVLTTQ